MKLITALCSSVLVRLAKRSASRRNVAPVSAIPGIEITPTALGSTIIKQTTPEGGQIVVTATYIQQFLEAVSEVGKRAIQLRKSRPKQPDVRTIKGRRVRATTTARSFKAAGSLPTQTCHQFQRPRIMNDEEQIEAQEQRAAQWAQYAEGAAMFLAAASALCAIVGFVAESGTPLWAAGGFFGGALWLVLHAQLLHIRAGG